MYYYMVTVYNAELSMGWVDPRVGLGWVGSGMGRKFLFFSGLGHGSKMTDVRKLHVVYICNIVSSIDWQIRFVKTCSWCITASSV